MEPAAQVTFQAEPLAILSFVLYLPVATSGVVRDIYQKIVAKKKSISQKKLVFLSRIVVLFLVIVALVFGAIAKQYVFWLVLFAWGGSAFHSDRRSFLPFSGRELQEPE